MDTQRECCAAGRPIDQLLTFRRTTPSGRTDNYIYVNDALANINCDLKRLNSTLAIMNVRPVVRGGLIRSIDAEWVDTILKETRLHVGEHRPVCMIDQHLLGVLQ